MHRFLSKCLKKNLAGDLSFICLALLTTVFGAIAAADEFEAANPRQQPVDSTVSFNRDIRPLLSDRCYLCHGPDEKAREAELRLDSREATTGGAIIPGDADASEVIARITSSDPDYQMPPPASNKSALTTREIALFRRWINEGAKYEDHWAFQPPRRPELPPVTSAAWSVNPIDRFIFSRLESEGIVPSPRADRRTRLRRASLDLIGLPPTQEDIELFLADKSSEAWPRALDRMFKSSAYGEHQARFWLDAARYADSNGYQYDLQREQWAWRDWVINAFNKNQPFDQFTVEQLAGDLLPAATNQQRLATGFNRNHPITIEGGIIDEEYRVEYVLDRTVTAGTVWLGLTVGCSRCHDHKYDPLSQREFYQLSGFFNQVPERGMKGFNPRARIPSPFVQPQVDQAKKNLDKAVTKFRKEFAKSQPDQTAIAQDVLKNSDRGWEILALKSFSATSIAKMRELSDRSILVSGFHSPVSVTYEVVAGTNHQQIHGIRLAALTHESLPHGGTSRSDNGNFVLSEIEIEAAPKSSPQDYTKIKLAAAHADYSQVGYSVSRAIDGKGGNSGWAVDGDQPALRESRLANFLPDKPFGFEGGTLLKIRLHFSSEYSNHQIGRFQLALNSTGENLDTLEAVRILRKPEQQRTATEQLAVAEFVSEKSGTSAVKQALRSLQTAREQYDQAMARVSTSMVMQDRAQPRSTYVLERGEYDKRREEVHPATPAALPAMPNDLPKNRLGFARWLTMSNHPLTARVTVNRFWQQIFGVGLVDTPEDFGLQGSTPTHPELLDWLAVEFVESGWDVQALFKLIMTSQTYQQASHLTGATHARDPYNRLLARGPRQRLDAETIRDSALAVSGLLHEQLGGPSVFPYHPQGLWLEVNNRPGYSSRYRQDHGQKLYRRSLYTYWKRTVPPPTMAVFDAPSREYCQVRRSRTNTPLQAFVLLHDPQFVEAARALAEKMLLEGGDLPAEQIRFGFERCLGRLPNAEEQLVLLDNYRTMLLHYDKNPAAAEQLLSIGESPRNADLSTAPHAAMTSVSRLLLNLSEFVTKS